MGSLGEYASLLHKQGPQAAESAFPEIAAHLGAGCEMCTADLAELSAFFEDEQRRGAEPYERRWLLATPLLAWSYQGGYSRAASPEERRLLPTQPAPVFAIAVFQIPEYPELILEAAPSAPGTRMRLAVPAGTSGLDQRLDGWDVRVTSTSTAAPFSGVTDDQGAAHLDQLPIHELTGAQVLVRPPPAE